VFLGALLNDSREEYKSIEVFGHLRGGIFYEHLHLINQLSFNFARLTLSLTLLTQVFAGVALLALRTHSLNDLTCVLRVNSEAVESDFEDVSLQEFFWKLIIMHKKVG